MRIRLFVFVSVLSSAFSSNAASIPSSFSSESSANTPREWDCSTSRTTTHSSNNEIVRIQRFDLDISSLEHDDAMQFLKGKEQYCRRVASSDLNNTTASIKSTSESLANEDTPSFAAALRTSSASVTESTGKITIVFECTAQDVTLCPKAKTAYQNAADYLTSIIKLKRDIKVQAQFYSFCKAGSCSNKTLGQAQPKSFYTVKNVPGVDDQYWYPAPLAKQLTSSVGNDNSFDVWIQFNADNPSEFATKGYNRFWFHGDPAIKPDQYDFEYVVLHEMIHGFGFVSGLGQYITSSMSPGFKGITFAMNFDRDSSGTIRGIEKIYPPLIFDKYLYTRSGYALANDYGSLINGLDKATSISQWMNMFMNSPGYAVSQKLYKLVTTNESIVFKVPGQSYEVVLHTRYSEFQSGSSISHIDQVRYTNDEDFLMRPEAQAGVTLLTLSKNKFPIGRKTVGMLYAMGYSVTDMEYLNSGALVTSATGSLLVLTTAVALSIITTLF